jgi:hypothetical protein
MAGGDVVDDFKDNHALNLTLSYVQNITYIVGRMGEKKEDEIVYSLPKLGGEVATVSIGVDGTAVMLVMMDGENQWLDQYRYMIKMEIDCPQDMFPKPLNMGKSDLNII